MKLIHSYNKEFKITFYLCLPRDSANLITAYKFLFNVLCKLHLDWLIMMSLSNIHVYHPIRSGVIQCTPFLSNVSLMKEDMI